MNAIAVLLLEVVEFLLGLSFYQVLAEIPIPGIGVHCPNDRITARFCEFGEKCCDGKCCKDCCSDSSTAYNKWLIPILVVAIIFAFMVAAAVICYRKKVPISLIGAQYKDGSDATTGQAVVILTSDTLLQVPPPYEECPPPYTQFLEEE